MTGGGGGGISGIRFNYIPIMYIYKSKYFVNYWTYTPFTPGLRPRCDRILGFGRNDRGHSPSVSKTSKVSIVS